MLLWRGWLAFQSRPLPSRWWLLAKAATPSQYLPRHPEHETKSVELVHAMSERLRVPAECRDLAAAAAGWHGKIHGALTLKADGLLALYEGCDALRRPERFHALLEVAGFDHHGRLGYDNVPFLPTPFLLAGLARLQALDQGAIAKSVNEATIAGDIATAIRDAKRVALKKFIDDHP